MNTYLGPTAQSAVQGLFDPFPGLKTLMSRLHSVSRDRLPENDVRLFQRGRLPRRQESVRNQASPVPDTPTAASSVGR